MTSDNNIDKLLGETEFIASTKVFADDIVEDLFKDGKTANLNHVAAILVKAIAQNRAILQSLADLQGEAAALINELSEKVEALEKKGG